MSVDISHSTGFIPQHPAPARYLKVRNHNKKDKTFNRIFLAQELDGSNVQQKVGERRISTSINDPKKGGTGKAVWAVEFSKDGKYLAAAGQDRKVRVWAVITTPEEREAAIREDGNVSYDEHDSPRLKAPVFRPKPVQIYEGHTGSILDLSWSKVSGRIFREQLDKWTD